uniref:Uncharacterized protein n=1 Tax=Angiostrongylus cantonensis TaxID=6313 RepID=A0A158P8X4_ANGCA
MPDSEVFENEGDRIRVEDNAVEDDDGEDVIGTKHETILNVQKDDKILVTDVNYGKRDCVFPLRLPPPHSHPYSSALNRYHHISVMIAQSPLPLDV